MQNVQTINSGNRRGIISSHEKYIVSVVMKTGLAVDKNFKIFNTLGTYDVYSL
jgi:hypothetical protein